MAEVIARKRLHDLGWSTVEVASAGVAAYGGSPASGGAVRAAAAKGLDLGAHVSAALTSDAVQAADLVLTMSSSHIPRVGELGGSDRAAVITTFASGGGVGGASGVPDPIGGPDEEYAETLEVLDQLIARALERIEPMIKS